ncbi:hypothetical protein TI39_contig685g00003 [Zymoseptoria brevis]|uniref:Uncharacterized protein n=1 Tax=Zymoseptoria brevis TaxID=1047168 RepID=A0A0F4GJ91_9PEZI|nr:hypothetical protein TI39_contig685g00003 [Zymoseptoria brevis]
MSTLPTEDPQWEIDYDAALGLYKSGQFVKAICAAKRTLTNKDLNRFFQAMNCILIVFCEDDWHEAEEVRLIAEDVYRSAEREAPRDDEFEQLRVTDLRRHLDTLERMQKNAEPSGDQSDDEEEEDEEAEDRDRLSEPDIVRILFRSLHDLPFFAGQPYWVDISAETAEDSEGEIEERLHQRALQKRQSKKRPMTQAETSEDGEKEDDLQINTELLPGSNGQGHDQAWNSAVLTKRRRMQEATMAEHESEKMPNGAWQHTPESDPEPSNVDKPGVRSSSDAFGLKEDKVLNDVASNLPRSPASSSAPQPLAVHLPSLAALLGDGPPLSDSHTPLLSVPVTGDVYVDQTRRSTDTDRSSVITASTQSNRNSFSTLHTSPGSFIQLKRSSGSTLGSENVMEEESPSDLPLRAKAEHRPDADFQADVVFGPDLPPPTKRKPEALSLSKATTFLEKAWRPITSARSLAGFFKGQATPTQATPTQAIFNQTTPTQASFKKSSPEKSFVARSLTTPTTAQLSPEKPTIAESPSGSATAQQSPEKPWHPQSDVDGNVNPYLEDTGQLPMTTRFTVNRNSMQKTSRQKPVTQKPAQQPARGILTLELFTPPRK